MKSCWATNTNVIEKASQTAILFWLKTKGTRKFSGRFMDQTPVVNFAVELLFWELFVEKVLIYWTVGDVKFSCQKFRESCIKFIFKGLAAF